MKLSNTLFAVALAQYDYDGFDYLATSTGDVQTTPISIDPNSLSALNFDLSEDLGPESSEILSVLASISGNDAPQGPRGGSLGRSQGFDPRRVPPGFNIYDYVVNGQLDVQAFRAGLLAAIQAQREAELAEETTTTGTTTTTSTTTTTTTSTTSTTTTTTTRSTTTPPPSLSFEDLLSQVDLSNSQAGSLPDAFNFEDDAAAEKAFGNRPNILPEAAEKNFVVQIPQTYCPKCDGVDYASCSASTYEACNNAQSACLVQYRYVNGAPLYWSGCKSEQPCITQQDENFLGGAKIHDKCKSNRFPSRWLNGAECAFCLPAGDPLSNDYFQSGGNVYKTAVISAVLSDPEQYLDPAAGSYLFNL
ncbi:Oidioi.mRNA.OKI2018_I69.chr1.g277.t1.cds [Oikopleura dioica]|uniref:Oidioi.mRNA.OKI2018_I69.chr1.g277.t1.cds n=1 Tax=Oikopleura dioica TaxID=34765 RepID=A0ABN7SPJ9_OIKDI|nr:Oidioi.mRNA.OKI2018_I69.chr1.g277.t1.cds [Oikopleura dioica]